jgi:microcystin-dependent protein
MYDFLFMLIFIILSLIYYKLPDNSKENFDTTTDIKTAVNQLYNADIEAIRNLSSISSQLIAGGLTVPGNLSVNGSLNILPAGLVIAWTGSSSPTGWLICDGSIYQISIYPKLGALLGKTFGGDGSSTFAVPNYKGAFLRGTGTSPIDGTYIGPAVNNYQAQQLLNHTHTGTTSTAGRHSHSQKVDGDAAGSSRGGDRTMLRKERDVVGYINEAGEHNHTFTTDNPNTGGSELRPYNYGVNWVIKI